MADVQSIMRRRLDVEHARGAHKALRFAQQALAACTSLEDARACLDAMVDGSAIRLPAVERVASGADALDAMLQEYLHD